VTRLRARTVYCGLEFLLALPSYVFIAVFHVGDLHMSPLRRSASHWPVEV
jgi:hypothetical protein